MKMKQYVDYQKNCGLVPVFELTGVKGRYAMSFKAEEFCYWTGKKKVIEDALIEVWKPKGHPDDIPEDTAISKARYKGYE